MISYYDIRAARSAMRALQNKPLRRRKLDIHFSIPKVLGADFREHKMCAKLESGLPSFLCVGQSL